MGTDSHDCQRSLSRHVLSLLISIHIVSQPFKWKSVRGEALTLLYTWRILILTFDPRQALVMNLEYIALSYLDGGNSTGLLIVIFTIVIGFGGKLFVNALVATDDTARLGVITLGAVMFACGITWVSLAGDHFSLHAQDNTKIEHFPLIIRCALFRINFCFLHRPSFCHIIIKIPTRYTISQSRIMIGALLDLSGPC